MFPTSMAIYGIRSIYGILIYSNGYSNGYFLDIFKQTQIFAATRPGSDVTSAFFQSEAPKVKTCHTKCMVNSKVFNGCTMSFWLAKYPFFPR
jgi:hypothetical protein